MNCNRFFIDFRFHLIARLGTRRRVESCRGFRRQLWRSFAISRDRLCKTQWEFSAMFRWKHPLLLRFFINKRKKKLSISLISEKGDACSVFAIFVLMRRGALNRKLKLANISKWVSHLVWHSERERKSKASADFSWYGRRVKNGKKGNIASCWRERKLNELCRVLRSAVGCDEAGWVYFLQPALLPPDNVVHVKNHFHFLTQHRLRWEAIWKHCKAYSRASTLPPSSTKVCLHSPPAFRVKSWRLANIEFQFGRKFAFIEIYCRWTGNSRAGDEMWDEDGSWDWDFIFF